MFQARFPSTSIRVAFRLLAIVVVCGGLSVVSATADVITVDWDVVPHDSGELDPTPYYSCVGSEWGWRSCTYQWERGMEVAEGGFFPVNFFDDMWFEGFAALPENEILSEGNPETVLDIRPRCEPGLAPCFDTFTPMQLDLSAHSWFEGPVNLYARSSLGGLIKAPMVDGHVSLMFAGSDWEDVEWMQLGFYQLAACSEAVPPEDLECGHQLRIISSPALTFDAELQSVPEPVLSALLGAAVAAGLVRRRRARS